MIRKSTIAMLVTLILVSINLMWFATADWDGTPHDDEMGNDNQHTDNTWSLEDDWEITNGMQVQVKGKVLYLQGEILVYQGGSLDIDDCTIIFDCAFDGDCGIVVEGYLNITNSSIEAPGNPYFFHVNDPGVLRLENSFIDGCGWSAVAGYQGLTVSGIGGRIINNTFTNCFTGIDLRSGDDNIVQKNTIKWSTRGIGVVVGANSNNVSYNTIIGTALGLFIQNVDGNDIEHNIIQRNNFGVQCAGTGLNNITNNSLSNPTNVMSVAANNWNYNYFCDYMGTDTNGDWIGDSTAYTVSVSSDDDNPRTKVSLSSSTNTYARPSTAYAAAAQVDTVTMKQGLYYDTVAVNKNVDFVGGGYFNTNWVGNSAVNPTIDVQGNVFCNISDITFENAPFGINYDLNSNKQSLVTNCTFQSDVQIGIEIDRAMNKEITWCQFLTSDNGINVFISTDININHSFFMGGLYGIYMIESWYVEIFDCELMMQGNDAIYMEDCHVIDVIESEMRDIMGGGAFINVASPMKSSYIDIFRCEFLGMATNIIQDTAVGMNVRDCVMDSRMSPVTGGVLMTGGAWLNVTNCTFKGIPLAVFNQGFLNVFFENNTVRDYFMGGAPAVAVANAAMNTHIKNNQIRNYSGASGVWLGSIMPGPAPTMTFIENNTIAWINGDGIVAFGMMSNVNNIYIRNNSIHSCTGAGVNIGNMVAASLIENNTLSNHNMNAADTSGVKWRMNYYGDYDGSSRIADTPVQLQDGAWYQIAETAGLSGTKNYMIPGPSGAFDPYPRTKVSIQGRPTWTAASLQVAINLGLIGGDTIMPDVGIYYENIFVPDKYHFVGADQAKTIVNGSIGGGQTFWFTGTIGSSIQNLTVEGANDGINITGTSSEIRVENCTLRDNTRGLSMEDSDHIYINNTMLISNGLQGSLIRSKCFDIYLEKVHTLHNPIGIHMIDNLGYIYLDDINGHHHNYGAIIADRSVNPIILSNSWLHNDTVGLGAIESENVTVEYTTFTDHMQGIVTDKAANCFFNDSIIDRAQYGIFLTNSEYLSLNDNFVYNSEIGILLFYTNWTDIYWNTVDSCEIGMGIINSSFNGILWNTMSNINNIGIILGSYAAGNSVAFGSIEAEIGVLLQNISFNGFFWVDINANTSIIADSDSYDTFQNCTITSETTSVQLANDANLYFLNTTFDETKVQFEEDMDFALVTSDAQGGLGYDPHNERLLGKLEDTDLIKFIAGDLNGDGYEDLIASNLSAGTNEVQVYLGRPDEFSPDVPDHEFSESGTTLAYGQSLALGDFNDDGIDDLVVGDPGYNSDEGRVWVYYGGATIDTTADVTLSPPGAATNWSYGWDVAAGDHDGDGDDEIMVSAPFFVNHTSLEGKVYMYYGSTTPDNVADLTLSATMFGSYFGYALEFGDLDSDGDDEAIIGAPRYDWIFEGFMENDVGQVLVYDGSSTPDKMYDYNFTGTEPYEHFGFEVVTGDFNGDFYDDVIASAPDHDGSMGAVRIYLGGPAMDERIDTELEGHIGGERYGYSIGVGRFNEDHCADLIIGAPMASRPGVGVEVGYIQTVMGAEIGQTESSLPPYEFEYWTKWGAFINEHLGEGVWAGHLRTNSTLTVANYLHVRVRNSSGPYQGAHVVVTDNGLTAYDRYTDASGSRPYLEVIDRIFDGQNKSVENVTEVQVTYPSYDETRDVNMSTSHWEYFGNTGPTASLIPDVSIQEDSIDNAILDLSLYFTVSPFITPGTLSYSVESNNQPGIALLSVVGTDLAVDMQTGAANDNWTGLVNVTVRCTDALGDYTVSNQFQINVTNLNDDPLIDGVTTISINEDASFYRLYSVTDGDLMDTHTWSLNTTASFLSISDGNLSGTPSNSDVGVHMVNVTVADGVGAEGWLMVQVTVVNTNDAPTLDALPDQTKDEGSEPWDLDLAPYANDVDISHGDSLKYYITGEDTSLFTVSGENTSSTLTFTLVDDDVNGVVTVIVWVEDEAGMTASRPLLITINPLNDGPRIQPVVPDVEFPEDEEWFINLTGHAVDPEGDAVSWYITGENSSLFSIGGENTSSNLTITPVPDMNGNVQVTLWVEDIHGASSSQELWINVTPVNDAPFFVDLPTTYSVKIGEDLDIDLTSYIDDIDTDLEDLTVSDSSDHGDVSGKVVTFNYPASFDGEEDSVNLFVSDGEFSDMETITITLVREIPTVEPNMAINISGSVYYGAGIYEGVLVSGATVVLKNASGTVATTTTDSSGAFEFIGVIKGIKYTFDIAPPAADAADEDNNVSGYLELTYETAILTKDAVFNLNLPYYNATSGETSGGGGSGGEVTDGTGGDGGGGGTGGNGTGGNGTGGNGTSDGDGGSFVEDYGLFLALGIVILLILLIIIVVVIIMVTRKGKPEEEGESEPEEETPEDAPDEEAGPAELEDEVESEEELMEEADEEAEEDTEFIEPEIVSEDEDIPGLDELDEDFDDEDFDELEDLEELEQLPE